MPTAEVKIVELACWFCVAPVAHAQLFCSNCGKVQPAQDGADYFEVFNLARKLAIDTTALEQQFYRLSRRLHPDVYARASVEEQEWSLRNASLLNDAYRTLKDPIARTEYLLRLEGVEIQERGKQPIDRKNTSRVPIDLLEEVFELNMQLEKLRRIHEAGDADLDLRENLLSAKRQFQEQLAETDRSVEQLGQEWDQTPANNLALVNGVKQRMVVVLDRRRYILNLVRDVVETLDA